MFALYHFFSPISSLLKFHFAFLRSKSECISVSVPLIQLIPKICQASGLIFCSPLLQLFISIFHALNYLNLHTLRATKHHLDALVFLKAGCGFKFFHRLLDAILCVFLLGISTVFPCSFSALHANIVRL